MKARPLRRALQAGAYLLASLAMVWLLWTADLRAVGAALRSVGPLAALVLAPLGIQLLLEAVGWRLPLERLGHGLSLAVAWRVNLQSEAVRLSFPGGPPLAEGLRPVLLQRCASVPLSAGATALVVRKLCHMATQGLFLGVGAALGSALFAAWERQLGPAGRVLPLLSWVAAAGLTSVAVLMGLVISHGSLATRAERLLGRWGRLSSFLEGRRAAFAALDSRLHTLLWRSPGMLSWSIVTAMGGWLLDAAEMFIVLRLLGYQIGYGQALAVEALVSVIRIGAFAVPGGLGIQDFTYHALLQGTVGETTAMSFVLLKRARDAFWVVAGFSLPLALDRFWFKRTVSSGAVREVRALPANLDAVAPASPTPGTPP